MRWAAGVYQRPLEGNPAEGGDAFVLEGGMGLPRYHS